MRRAALIFNPNAGRGGPLRLTALERAVGVLRDHAVDAEIIATSGPGTAGAQAADAVRRGVDLIFACGGDGTVHEVIQGIAGNLSVTLGVLPLGSANALARHLGIAFDAARAVRQQLGFSGRDIPLGRVTCETSEGPSSRYFVVMAGAGPDGMLVYRMLATHKQRFGRMMYYVRAARLFLGSRFPEFQTRATLEDGRSVDRRTVSAMAIRVRELGGVFSPLIRGASPADETLQLTLTKPPYHFSLPAWFATSWTRTHRWNRYTEHVRVSAFSCGAAGDQRVHVQADGEFVGYTPMRVEIVPNALRLLMPTSRKVR